MISALPIKVIDEFKAGKFNTLVCTSIGEEGLDIGEVDFIVCYDSHKAPIKMVRSSSIHSTRSSLQNTNIVATSWTNWS